MRNRVPILGILLAVGCNAQDAATLGRIGQKVHDRAEKILTDEPNGSMIKTLPLLQTPGPDGKAKPPETATEP